MKKKGEGGSKKGFFGNWSFKKKPAGSAAPEIAVPPAMAPMPVVAKPRELKLPPHAPPRAYDEKTLSGYPNFQAMCSDMEEFPECRKPLLNALITSDALFGRYICNIRNLQTLMIMMPDKTDYFIDMILRDPECQGTFLNCFRLLPKFLDLFKDSEERQSKILNAVFDTKEIHARFCPSIEVIDHGIEQFPAYRKKILDNLVKNKELIEQCFNTNREKLYLFIKKHTDYTERFVDYLFTSDLIYKHIVFFTGKYIFLKEFPNLLDRFMNFVLSDDKRLSSEFSQFEEIFEFGKKYPDDPNAPDNLKYVQRMINKALSLKAYVKRDMHSCEQILAVEKIDSALAKTIVGMALKDEHWILRVINCNVSLDRANKSELLKPFADAFFPILFKDAKLFTDYIVTERTLNEMLALAPDDLKPKLWLYYRIYSQEKPLFLVFGKYCNDAATINELSVYISRVFDTLEPDVIKKLKTEVTRECSQAREHQAGEDIQLALQNLQNSLNAGENKLLAGNQRFTASMAPAIEPQKNNSPPKDLTFKQ